MGNRGKLGFGINFVSLSKNFMKNLVLLLFFTAFSTTSAQCNIEGKTSLNIGETAEYSISNEWHSANNATNGQYQEMQ